MKAVFLSTTLLMMPVLGAAEGIPIYIHEGRDLYYTGETMTIQEAIDRFGPDFGAGADVFGPPEFVAKRHNGYLQSYVTTREYELVYGGDGEVSGAPDDLTFAEGEGTDTREDMTFAEGEGTDTREDMTFAEGEGTDTREDMTFDEGEGTDTREDLTFTEGDALADLAAQGGPTDMFKSANGPAVTPSDGVWRVVIVDAKATGCPAGAAATAQAQVQKTRTLNVTFRKPKWHPADLGGELGSYSWREIGENGYFSYPYATGPEMAGSGMSLAVSTAYIARTPTYIDTWYRVRVNLAPFLAAIAGSGESCEVIIRGELRK